MKISPTLLKVIKTVVEQQNSKARSDEAKHLAQAKEEILKRPAIAKLLKERVQVERSISELVSRRSAIDSRLSDDSLTNTGHPTWQLEESLRRECKTPRFNEAAIVAELAKAKTEQEANAVLKKVGINH